MKGGFNPYQNWKKRTQNKVTLSSASTMNALRNYIEKFNYIDTRDPIKEVFKGVWNLYKMLRPKTIREFVTQVGTHPRYRKMYEKDLTGSAGNVGGTRQESLEDVMNMMHEWVKTEEGGFRTDESRPGVNAMIKVDKKMYDPYYDPPVREEMEQLESLVSDQRAMHQQDKEKTHQQEEQKQLHQQSVFDKQLERSDRDQEKMEKHIQEREEAERASEEAESASEKIQSQHALELFVDKVFIKSGIKEAPLDDSRLVWIKQALHTEGRLTDAIPYIDKKIAELRDQKQVKSATSAPVSQQVSEAKVGIPQSNQPPAAHGATTQSTELLIKKINAAAQAFLTSS